jgi:hypothetical protein
LAITYHAGRRIQGTQADFDGTPAVSGGWKELGRTSNSSLPDVTSLADKKYLMFLNFQESNASRPVPSLRLNGDSSSIYARRGAYGGGSDYTNTNKTLISFSNQPSTNDTVPYFTVGYIANKSDKEKLMMINNTYSEGGTGASDAPQRVETVGKWTNTSDAVDQLSIVSSAGGTFNTNGELVVLGYDPADTHTTNFWEELASVSGTGSSTEISSGTISAKKYLWLQMWNNTGATSYTSMTFNNDTGSNYARRTSEDGSADSTAVSETAALIPPNVTGAHFMNIFIINNSANEKLCMFSNVGGSSAGAGTVPLRSEGVFKWANTSAQITEIDMTSSSGNYTSNSILKVWGHD